MHHLMYHALRLGGGAVGGDRGGGFGVVFGGLVLRFFFGVFLLVLFWGFEEGL